MNEHLCTYIYMCVWVIYPSACTFALCWNPQKFSWPIFLDTYDLWMHICVCVCTFVCAHVLWLVCEAVLFSETTARTVHLAREHIGQCLGNNWNFSPPPKSQLFPRRAAKQKLNVASGFIMSCCQPNCIAHERSRKKKQSVHSHEPTDVEWIRSKHKSSLVSHKVDA